MIVKAVRKTMCGAGLALVTAASLMIPATSHAGDESALIGRVPLLAGGNASFDFELCKCLGKGADDVRR